MEQIRFWSPWLLNHWFWPMLWQSSLLIGVLFLIDFGFRRKLRPVLRYALWLVLLVKLVLPPSLALPTGVAWWLRPAAVTSTAKPRTSTFAVTYGPAMLPEPRTELPAIQPPLPPPLPPSVWALLAWSLVSVTLLIWMLFRWAQVANTARSGTEAPSWLTDLVVQGRKAAALRRPVRVRLTTTPMSPAVCGFFWPVILLPRALTNLSEKRLRAVLLHELIHLRRGDVWLNCAQALLQILYWWHPLLWLANARIRRLREEAVDDAVMLALRDDAADYAPTLLEVARLALQRPLTSLGLVGILESKTALRCRIERLVDFRAPRKAGLTFASILGLGFFTALAVPMGEAPTPPQRSGDTPNAQTNLWPDPRVEGYTQVQFDPQFYLVDGTSLRAVLPALLSSEAPLILSSNEVAHMGTTLRQVNAQPACASQPLSFAKFSGGRFLWHIGGTTNMTINYHAKEVGGRTIVTGANVEVATSLQEWIPLTLNVVPWTDGTHLRCELELAWSDKDSAPKQATAVLPPHGAMLWAKPVVGFSGKYEMVILRRDTAKTEFQVPSIATASHSTSRSVPVASTTNQSSTASLDNFLKAQTKVQDGKLLFEMDKLDEAETSLSQALILDPQSQGAQYYLKLVQEARRKQVEKNAKGTPRPAGPVGPTAGESKESRKEIWSRLNRIHVDEVSFDNVPLNDVLKNLSRRSWNLDPEKRGINFIVNPGKITINGEETDVRQIPIRIVPGLVDVRLVDLADAIVKVADARIKYAIEDDAVVFSPKGPDALPLYTRIFKVDPMTFEESVNTLPPLDPTSLPWLNEPTVGNLGPGKSYLARIRQFFLNIGVGLNPPKSVFYKDLDGRLVVRATLQELDTIDAALKELRPSAPTNQTLYVRIIKVDPTSLFEGLKSATGSQPTMATLQKTLAAFFTSRGAEIKPPKSIFFNDRDGTLVIRASLQDLDTIEQAVQVLNISPPQIHIKAKFIEVPREQLAELELETGINPTRRRDQTEMIFTVPQTKVLLKALESNSEVEIVGEASVTTLSGRQTEIQVLSDAAEMAQRQVMAPLLTNLPPVGVTLDISPSAQVNDPTIQLSGKAVATDFLGIDNPGPLAPTNWDTRLLNGDAVVIGQPAQPLPHFRVRELTFNNTVYDGQTLVLCRLAAGVDNSKAGAGRSKKFLLVLITPTLIDPAGNRIYKEGQPQR
jgi:beta-lactamase regulating signal transducer with metallopeptidase domain